jgi:uncharacterized protein YgbK (DUF1537 family)
MAIPRLAIIADDLTGALDAAAPFAGEGMRVCAALKPDVFADVLASEPDIVAVSTRSREVDADDARDRVARVLAAIPPGTKIMKKIDSRLKGNIGPELQAFGNRRFIAVPAIPQFGRVVRNGELSGFGIERPIHVASRFAPVETAVPDVIAEKDFDAIVESADSHSVLVGARGVAAALARQMGIAGASTGRRLTAPVCFAIGSNDPITLGQIETLRETLPTARFAGAPSGVLPSGIADTDDAGITMLQIIPGPETDRESVARNFARSVAGSLDGMRSVVLAGGATAEAVFDALGIDRLEVECEAQPGLPLCRSGKRIFVTKSGGFGDAGTLLRLLPEQSQLRNIA